jgi:thioredoxin reductase
LISINKVYTGYDDTEVNLRWDWNSLLCDEPKLLFKNYSREYFPDADVMVRYLADFAAHYRLKVKYNSRVVRVTRDNGFVVQDQDGRVYRGKVLIVATGCPEANIPKVPGIELAESYNSMSIDPEDFAGQRVLILGKGNSAFETANHLVGTTALIHLASPHPVKMAWKTHHVGHLRAVNNDLLDTYMLKSQNALLDGEIESLRRDGDKIIARVRYAHAADEVEELTYDRVLCCTGFRCDVSMFDETCPPEMAIMGRFPAQNSNWESTNIPDLYFAGTLMQTRDFKKKQSGFIHGFRYNVQTLFHMLREKYHGVAFPSTRVEATPEALTDYFLHRANKNSSLWQQTGFLCDVALATPQEIRYFEDLPVDYVHDRLGQQDGDYYTMTLEFGQERIDACHDVFAIERVHKDDCHRAEMSTGIHPIIRRYRRGQKISEHHVLEDLASEWKEDVHVLPLIEYFRQQLGRGSPQLVGCPS